MSEIGKPQQFKIQFEEEKLDRLERRLTDAWLPDSPIVPPGDHDDWEYGTHLKKLKEMVNSWRDGNPNGSDGKPVGPKIGVKKWWRGVEERLNRHPHFKVQIEGVEVHYQLAKSSSPNAIPLIFSHGYPGSFFEADLIIDLLSNPTNGGQAFDVVVPSLVGYGLSSSHPRAGWTLKDTARLFNTLMTAVLGYENGYVAQGGDWGSAITRYLANYPECKAFNVNFLPPNPPLYAKPVVALEMYGEHKGKLAGKLLPYLFDEFETRGIVRAMEYLQEGSGYFAVQSTKPASLGYGLYDSPVANLSWLVEKFQIWSDPRCPSFCLDPSKVENSSGVNDENILINCTLYYLSGTSHTSLLPYKENPKAFFELMDKKLTNPARNKPFGYSAFPYELAGSPKAWIPRLNVNLQFYKRHEYGGHFAALDNPKGLSEDLQEFFAQHYPLLSSCPLILSLILFPPFLFL